MRFLDSYPLTEPLEDDCLSVISKIVSKVNVKPGIYQDASLFVLDSQNRLNISLDNWQWLLPTDSQVIAYTGLGDFFIWSESVKAIYFVETQYGTKEFIDSDLDWFLNEFLIKKEIAKAVLKTEKVSDISGLRGQLEYGACFILQPWACLGGEDVAPNYVAGDFAVYLDLVGQMYIKSIH